MYFILEHVFASIPKQILLDIEDINENIGNSLCSYG